MSQASNRQKHHFDNILGDYDQHYFDPESQRYRERFFYLPLFAGLDLNDKRVIDLACGSGYNSLAILERFPRADVCGLDISFRACRNYEQKVGGPAYCADLTVLDVTLPAPADAAVVIGGLHHCVTDLPTTMANLARIVRPGGILLMVEPNADCFLNNLRLLWYRHDRYFDAQTERPLYHAELIAMASDWFRLQDVQYLGGPGYLVVLNSLLFRLPRSLKRLVAPPLTKFDGLYNQLPAVAPFLYFIARWRRIQ